MIINLKAFKIRGVDIYSSSKPKKTHLLKKKVELLVLFIWLLSLVVFISIAIFQPQVFSSLLLMTFVASFIFLVLCLPVWGFLLGNKLVKIITLTVSILVAFFTLGYVLVLRPNKISGLAMMPNLRPGDYVFSELVSYNYMSPKRGDVVIYIPPKLSYDRFISRVVGLPGEQISVKAGKVFINNESLNEPYLGAGTVTDSGPSIGDVNILIPDGQYVVLGDNRGQADDSRFFGFVKKSSILSRAFYIYWPPSDAGFITAGPPQFPKSSDISTNKANVENKFVTPLTSCQTLGTQMVTGFDGKGEIGCDVKVDGDIDLSKSYCESEITHMTQSLIPDAFGRQNQYYATLTGLNFEEKVQVFVYSPDGKRLECTPILNAK